MSDQPVRRVTPYPLASILPAVTVDEQARIDTMPAPPIAPVFSELPSEPTLTDLFREMRSMRTEIGSSRVEVHQLALQVGAVDAWMGSVDRELGHVGRDVRDLKATVKAEAGETNELLKGMAKRADELIGLLMSRADEAERRLDALEHPVNGSAR